MMTAFNRFQSFTLVALTASISFGAEVYRNDFSTRTSKKPIMTGRWHELAYETADKSLYYQYDDSQLADKPEAPYSAPWEFQDSWFKLYSASTGSRPALNVRKGSAAGSTNPYLAVVSNGTVNVATPIYNDFTSGVVRISCDIRALEGLDGEGAYVRIRPMYKRHLVPGAENTTVYLTAFGTQFHQGSVRSVLLYGNGIGGSQGLSLVEGVVRDHWYRYEVDLNLDTLRETGRVYDMGTVHPDISTTGSILGDFAANLKFNYNPSDEYGSVSGVMISLKNVTSKKDAADFDASVAPAVDNLVVAWKAPGASSYEPVYENDFGTRRYRTLSPAGTTEFGYGMSAASLTDRYSCAYHNVRLDKESKTPLLVPDPTTKDVQPVGYDGWRRVNKNGMGYAAAVDWSKNASGGTISGEEGGAVLRMTGRKALDGNNFCYVAVPIGETFTEGKLQLSADIRIPEKWTVQGSLSRYEAGIFLGDAAAYDEAETIGGHYAIRAGITGIKADGTKATKAFLPYHSTADALCSYDDHSLEPTNWYRVTMTVDLDNRTSGSSVKIWKLGLQSKKSTFEPSDLVFKQEGISLKGPNFPDIGTIILFGSGAGINDDDSDGTTLNRQRFICFDNIVLTKNVGTADEKVIYQNVFSSRTRTFDDVTSGGLVGSFNNDDGADHWIRRMSGTGLCRVFGEDDPHVAAWADGDSGSYAVHPLGKAVKVGTIRADIRPPKCWAAKSAASNSRIASVSLGGDVFLQGCHKGSTSFASEYGAMTFGFTDTDAAKDKTGVCTNIQAYVYGNGREFLTLSKKLNTSHWYRFAADFNSTEATWSVKVYDMGAEQPAADAADGELVAEKDGLQFRNPADGGISGLCLNTQGNAPVLANDPDDAGMALYDNVVLVEEDRGMMLIFK